MRETNIKIIRTQKYQATPDSNHGFNIAPNLFDQDFPADVPNQKWAGDISYISTSEGWLYLAVTIGFLFSAGHWLGCQQSDETRLGDASTRYGSRFATAAGGLHK